MSNICHLRSPITQYCLPQLPNITVTTSGSGNDEYCIDRFCYPCRVMMWWLHPANSRIFCRSFKAHPCRSFVNSSHIHNHLIVTLLAGKSGNTSFPKSLKTSALAPPSFINGLSGVSTPLAKRRLETLQAAQDLLMSGPYWWPRCNLRPMTFSGVILRPCEVISVFVYDFW